MKKNRINSLLIILGLLTFANLFFGCTLANENNTQDVVFVFVNPMQNDSETKYKAECILSGDVNQIQTVYLAEGQIICNFHFTKIPVGAKISIDINVYKVETNELVYQGSNNVVVTKGQNINIALSPNSSTNYDYNIGDLVCSDGTVIRYNENRKEFTFEEGVEPIAVIFRAGNKGNALGVGLKQGKKLWLNQDRYYGSSISSIHCFPQIYGVTTWGDCNETKEWYGDTDGSDNWSQICSSFKIDDNYLLYFPAIQFGIEYGNSNWPESYKNDWYLPSIAELVDIYLFRKEVNKVLNSLGNKAVAMNGTYWSSSMCSNKNVIALAFTNGNYITSLNITANELSLCRIHKF